MKTKNKIISVVAMLLVTSTVALFGKGGLGTCGISGQGNVYSETCSGITVNCASQENGPPQWASNGTGFDDQPNPECGKVALPQACGGGFLQCGDTANNADE